MESIADNVLKTRGLERNGFLCYNFAKENIYIISGVSGEDGSFVIDSPCNDGIIKVSSIGYTTVFRDCRGEDMGVIRLSEDSWMLGEIVVRSQLPKTVLSGEGMTTTVSGSVLEKTANMEQLLSRIPSVSAKDGDIEVFGRGTPVIYINGRKMQDQMELQRLQPSDIKNIEVISNPGPSMNSGPWLTEMTQGEIGEAYWTPVDGSVIEAGSQDNDAGVISFSSRFLGKARRIMSPKIDISKMEKLAGLFCCHFVCCHNCMFLKIIIGLLLFGGC